LALRQADENRQSQKELFPPQLLTHTFTDLSMSRNCLQEKDTMSNKLQAAIGKHISKSKSLDWFGYWPEVDEDMNVIAILDGDSIPEGATLLWEDGTETDGQHGFDAVRL
jgi:hypothetical protein